MIVDKSGEPISSVPVICESCGSKNIVARPSFGAVQRVICTDCGSVLGTKQ